MPNTQPTQFRAGDAAGLPVPDPDFEAKRKAALIAYFAGETTVEPKMHATDPGWFRDLSARISGLLVESAGGVLPFQSEGTLHGLPYYFRYRGGYASLTVMAAPAAGEEADLLCPLYAAGTDYGDDYAGSLSREEFYSLMLTLVPQLTEAAFLWEFQGVKVTIEDLSNPKPESLDVLVERRHQPVSGSAPERNPPDLRFTATDAPEVYRARGVTPADAYARLRETSQWLVSKGWSEDAQRANAAAKAIDPTPVNTDTRTFPYPRPVFEVLP